MRSTKGPAMSSEREADWPAGILFWETAPHNDPPESGRYLIIYETTGGKRQVFIADYDDCDGWLNMVRGTTVALWAPIPMPNDR